MACRLATSPTRISPSLKATTEGVVRDPSALAMITGSAPSKAAITLLVVPRSIPTADAILIAPPLFRFEARSPHQSVKGPYWLFYLLQPNKGAIIFPQSLIVKSTFLLEPMCLVGGLQVQ